MPTRHLPAPLSSFIQGPPTQLLASAPQLANFIHALRDELVDLRRGYGVWIAGGTPRSLTLGLAPRDLDLFFPNGDALAAAKRLLPTMYDCKLVGETELVVKFEVNLGLYSECCDRGGFIPVDLVRRCYATPLDTARAMDFVCCSAALSATTFVRHQDFEADAQARTLTVNAPWRPRSSWRRMGRFLSRGWNISDAERAKLQTMAEDARLPHFDFSDGAEASGWDYG